MVRPSLPEPRFHLESQIRECYGRCAYTHKTHEKMAERLALRQACAKWANIVLSALVAGGAVTALFDDTAFLAPYADCAELATAALAILSLIFNAYLKEIDPGALARRHREIASKIWNVRESYLSLLADTLDDSISIEVLRSRRDELQTSLHNIYLVAPHTDGKAYSVAQKGLKDSEELMFTENEIDVMLPQTLRRGN